MIVCFKTEEGKGRREKLFGDALAAAGNLPSCSIKASASPLFRSADEIEAHREKREVAAAHIFFRTATPMRSIRGRAKFYKYFP